MKSPKKLLPVLAILAAVAFTACPNGGSGDGAEEKGAKKLKGKIEAFGSSTAATLIGPLTDALEDEHNLVTVELQLSSTNWGLGALKGGMTQLGMATRPLRDDEKAAGLTAHPLARDGLGIALNKDNPVEKLTLDQIRDIFQGKITNWKEVGGNDAGIEPVNHAETRGSLVYFTKALGIEAGDVRYSERVISGDQDAIAQIAAVPNSITYLSIASGQTAIEEGKAIKMIGFGDAAPTAEAVAAGEVPATFEVSLVTKEGQAEDIAEALLELAKSERGKEIAKKHHFAPLGG